MLMFHMLLKYILWDKQWLSTVIHKPTKPIHTTTCRKVLTCNTGNRRWNVACDGKKSKVEKIRHWSACNKGIVALIDKLPSPNCHCTAKHNQLCCGKLQERTIIYNGASARLPRQQHRALLPRNTHFVRGVRRKSSGSAEDKLDISTHRVIE